MLLLAAKFGVPVCPHAGGLGLCEYVQHLSLDRLRVRERFARRSHDRVRRPPPRALRAPGRRARRPLRGAGRRPGYSVDLHPESYAALSVAGRVGVATMPDRAARRTRSRGHRGSGSAARRSATCSPPRRTTTRRRHGRRGLGRRHPLLRHRAALRARPRRSAGSAQALPRPPARRVRAVDEGRAAAPTGPGADPGDLPDVAASSARSSTTRATASCARSRRAWTGSGSTGSTSCSCTTPTTTRTTRSTGAFPALLELRDEGVVRRDRARA